MESRYNITFLIYCDSLPAFHLTDHRAVGRNGLDGVRCEIWFDVLLSHFNSVPIFFFFHVFRFLVSECLLCVGH